MSLEVAALVALSTFGAWLVATELGAWAAFPAGVTMRWPAFPPIDWPEWNEDEDGEGAESTEVDPR